MSTAFDRMKQTSNALKHFFIDRLSKAAISDPQDVRAGEGKLVQVGSRKVAVYRDEEGVFHALSPVCTHMKCIVDWNAADKSWDCPCHGSRFNAYGRVINGPAKRNLAHEDIDDES